MRIGGRWLVDGALVNPVPVSAARALGARLVIAVNLNADLFGRGTIIARPWLRRRATTRPPPTPKSQRPARHVQRRTRRCAGNSSARRGRPGIPTVMVEAFNVMQDRITRARLAGDPPDVLISPRLGHDRLVRFPPRRGSDRASAPRPRKKRSTRVNEAIAALSQPARAATAIVEMLTPCGCSRAAPRTRARFRRRAA